MNVGDSAIREDVQQEVESQVEKPVAKTDDYNPRAAAIAAIKADRMESLATELGTTPEEIAAKPTDVVESVKATGGGELDASAQIEAQSADEKAEDTTLTLDDLRGKKVRIKVDGVETVVDGEKFFASMQKGEAADKRLAAATEAQRKADAALEAANKKLQEATSAAEVRAAEKEIAAASADLDRTAKDFADALYSGDQEKAVGLFKEAVGAASNAAVEKALKGRTDGATPNESEIAARIAPAVQQRIEISSALQALDRDYPEIRKDDGFAIIADRERARLEQEEGLSTGEAILRAGEAVAKKYRFGKFADASADSGRPKDPVVDATTLSERRAAKARLDPEPKSTSARAASTASEPATASSTIAKIAASRGQQI